VRTPFYGHSQKNKSFGVGSTIKDYDPHSWSLRKEDLPSVDDFDSEAEYTPWELDRFADAHLWEALRTTPNWHDPVVLMHEHLHERRKREIYNAEGKPDAAITKDLSPDRETMYWRTHPRGRKPNSDRSRKKNKASYYR